jgi:hypothetical protein
MRTQVDPWVEQTSIQPGPLPAAIPRSLSNASENVGINAFSTIAKMATQLEKTRWVRNCISGFVCFTAG